jgi:hypothetical protein
MHLKTVARGPLSDYKSSGKGMQNSPRSEKLLETLSVLLHTHKLCAVALPALHCLLYPAVWLTISVMYCRHVCEGRAALGSGCQV